MSRVLRPRRGNSVQHSTFIGQAGELTVDIERKSVVVHDGTTAGGYDHKRDVEPLRGIKFLKAIPNVIQTTLGYHTDSGVGGGQWVWNPTRPYTDHDGGTVIAYPSIALYDGTPTTLAMVLNYSATSGSGCWERLNLSGKDLITIYGILGSSDAFLGVQKSLNTYFVRNGNLTLPKGNYPISSKLVVPFSSGGGSIVGAGSFPGDKQSGTRVNVASMLTWVGASGGTLLGGIGNLGLCLENVCFVGRPNGSAPRAGILFHCEQDTSETFGSGCGIMSNVSFYDSVIGVQMGTVLSDHNCADWTLIRFTAGKCDIAFNVKNIQGLNYNFQSPNIDLCQSFITTESGGGIFVTNLQASRCDGSAAGKFLFDFKSMNDNRSVHRINGLRIEQNCKNVLSAVGLGSVYVSGYEEAQANQNATMMQALGVKLTVSDSRLITRNLTNPHFYVGINSGGQIGQLFLHEIHFDCDYFDINEWVKLELNRSIPVQIKNCRYGQLGQFTIPEINSHLVYGPVRHFTITTDAVLKYALFDGGATTRGPHNVCTVPKETITVVEVTVSASDMVNENRKALFKRVATVSSIGDTITLISSGTIDVDINPDNWTILVEATSFGGIQTKVGSDTGTIRWDVLYQLKS